MAITPAIAVDEEFHGPKRYVVLGDGIAEDPLDLLVIRLQTHVELPEGGEHGRLDGHHGGIDGHHGGIGWHRGIIKANWFGIMLLAHHAERLVHVRREELVQPDLHRPKPLILVQAPDVRLSQEQTNINQKSEHPDTQK